MENRLTLRQALPHLKEISQETGLRLNRVKEFKTIYALFLARFYQ
jgi:hypothetical protein